MVFTKVLVLAFLAVSSLASPVHEAQSYSSFSSGISESHSPLTLSHAPVAISHAPVFVSHHAPLAVHHAPEVEHYAPAHYEFKYGVRDEHTHDIKEQAEKRDGDKVVGHYSLLEPDGTTRTVHYSSDKHTGFHAVVTKSGHASHPSHAVKVAVPVHKVISTPIISYAHSAPHLSYSHAPSHHSHGSATSFSSLNSGFEQHSGGYQ